VEWALERGEVSRKCIICRVRLNTTWLELIIGIAASPHRRIAASPHRRIAASPHRRIAASPHRRTAMNSGFNAFRRTRTGVSRRPGGSGDIRIAVLALPVLSESGPRGSRARQRPAS
jgi:hypothetical protein